MSINSVSSKSPFPAVPTIKDTVQQLSNGITTRVFAKRLSDTSQRISEIEHLNALRNNALMKLREQSRENVGSLESPVDSTTGCFNKQHIYDTHTQSTIGISRFLNGASIPNSTILADLKEEPPKIKNSATLSKERDEYVEKLFQRLEPNRTFLLEQAALREKRDSENLQSIRRRIERETQDDTLQELEQMLLEKDTKQAEEALRMKQLNSAPKNEWEELKEKRRISRRTSSFIPMDGGRRPTYENIRKSINNSQVIQQLIDVNKLEEEKLQAAKNKNKNKSLIVSDLPDFAALNQKYIVPNLSESTTKNVVSNKSLHKTEYKRSVTKTRNK